MVSTLAHEADLREVSKTTFFYNDDTPSLRVDGYELSISPEAFDSLLNHLKIPIKYLHRYATESKKGAEKDVNFWLKKADNIGAVVEDGTIIRTYDSRRLFIPASAVKQSVTKYLSNPSVMEEWDDGIYIGTYGTNLPDVELDNGDTAFISVRIQFSECFEIVPRIDAVLTVRGKYENYYFPIQGRKFRVVQSSAAQIINQILDFIDIVAEQVYKMFVPALNRMIGADARLNASAFVGRLCSELRISRKIGAYLLTGIEEENVALHELVRKVGNNILPEVRPDGISLDTAREIELALSRSIYKGTFR